MFNIENSYYKPSQQELLEDYIKSVDLLIIHDGKSKLEKQIKELKDGRFWAHNRFKTSVKGFRGFGMEEKVFTRYERLA